MTQDKLLQAARDALVWFDRAHPEHEAFCENEAERAAAQDDFPRDDKVSQRVLETLRAAIAEASQRPECPLCHDDGFEMTVDGARPCPHLLAQAPQRPSYEEVVEALKHMHDSTVSDHRAMRPSVPALEKARALLARIEGSKP